MMVVRKEKENREKGNYLKDVSQNFWIGITRRETGFLFIRYKFAEQYQQRN